MSARGRHSLVVTAMTAAASCIVAGTAGWAIGSGQNTSASQVQESTPAPGLLAGRVIDGTTGEGVSTALVVLTPQNAAVPAGRGVARGAPVPLPPSVIADANGRYVFQDLAPGSYTMTVTSAGFLPGAYGRRHWESTVNRPLVVTSGARLTDTTVRTWRRGVISGTLRDEAGEPIAGAPIRAFRRVSDLGVTRWVPQNLDNTDDRGVYRGAVNPGDYLVFAASPVLTLPAYAGGRCPTGWRSRRP